MQASFESFLYNLICDRKDILRNNVDPPRLSVAEYKVQAFTLKLLQNYKIHNKDT